MPKCLFLLVILLTLQDLSAQHFRNLSFEESGDAESPLPAGWTFREEALVSIDDSSPGPGGHSVCLNGNFSGNGNGYFFQKTAFKPGQAGKIRVSAYIRYENLENGFAGLFAFSKQGATYISNKNMGEKPLRGTAGWEKYSLEILVDPTVDTICIGGQLAADGKIWFDRFEVTPVSANRRKTAKPARKYLSAFLDIVEENALYKDSVDFNSIKQYAGQLIAGAQTTADCYPAIQYVLSRLNDHHSFFWNPDQVRAWETNQASGSAEPAPLVFSQGRVIDGTVGYLSMPFFALGDSLAGLTFADSLQHLIRSLDSKAIEGWVLDLRTNTGGNCWPMLAGIGPVLGEGVCGYFAATRGSIEWSYRSGGSYSGNQLIQQAGSSYQLFTPNPRVAVLTGPRTSSSGEVVAVAFRGRPDTRSFGEATGGYSTGNQNFKLSDGAMVFIASSVYADRNMNLYGKRIAPDEVIPAGDEDDPVLKRAVEWIRE
ncbi:MAG TPA: S41 family peptidase [Flavilitoribacter sp.]|nr:S41 family peptidase [Flavilitoribacter sp.]